jgi:hypothetical protein
VFFIYKNLGRDLHGFKSSGELSSRILEAKFLKSKLISFDFPKICGEILMSSTFAESSQDTVERKTLEKIKSPCL